MFLSFHIVVCVPISMYFKEIFTSINFRFLSLPMNAFKTNDSLPKFFLLCLCPNLSFYKYFNLLIPAYNMKHEILEIT